MPWRVTDEPVCRACGAEHVVVERKATYGADDRWQMALRCRACGAPLGSALAPEEGDLRLLRREEYQAKRSLYEDSPSSPPSPGLPGSDLLPGAILLGGALLILLLALLA